MKPLVNNVYTAGERIKCGISVVCGAAKIIQKNSRQTSIMYRWTLFSSELYFILHKLARREVVEAVKKNREKISSSTYYLGMHVWKRFSEENSRGSVRFYTDASEIQIVIFLMRIPCWCR